MGSDAPGWSAAVRIPTRSLKCPSIQPPGTHARNRLTRSGNLRSGAIGCPRAFRSDHQHYGTARFTRDGETPSGDHGRRDHRNTRRPLRRATLKICCSAMYGEVAFSPDEQTIANAGHWPSLWDARSGQLMARLTANREFLTSPNRVRCRPKRSPRGISRRPGICVGAADTARPVAVSPAQHDYVDALAVAANGWVIFAAFGKELQMWNPDTGQRRSLAGARATSNLVLGTDGGSILFGNRGRGPWSAGT